MTTDTQKTTVAKQPAEPKIKAVQVNPDTFDLICRALSNVTSEQVPQLNTIARDITDLKIAIIQIGQTLEAMGVDLKNIALANQHPGFRQDQAPTVSIDALSQRLHAIGKGEDPDDLPTILRNVKV